MNFTRRGAILGAAAALAVPAPVRAAANGQTGAVFAADGMALRGTDPVGYFTQGTLVAGRADLTTDWMGARWYFASAANREAFEMNPRAYAPKYGGYCAFAASKGAAAPTDPEAWTIVDGRLYLNYSLEVRDRWARDIPGNVARADENWPGILAALTA